MQIIAVVRQQFVMGINCSIFCTRTRSDPEVLQNCTSFTLCSSVGPAVGECPAVMDLTPCMLCVQIYCVLCIGLLSVEFSTVNTGLGRPMFWKPLRLLSMPEGLASTNYQFTQIT